MTLAKKKKKKKTYLSQILANTNQFLEFEIYTAQSLKQYS